MTSHHVLRTEIVCSAAAYIFFGLKMETRNITEIPHIHQQPLQQILGARFPTKGEVFRHLYYLRCIQNQPLHVAQQNAVEAARIFWLQAGITTKTNLYAVTDLEKLWNEFKVIE